MHFLKSSSIESDARLSKHFMEHQIGWILAERPIHERHQKAIVLAEKSIRIGWTYADAFKNVRKRILFKNRDYLFATKDYPSALEYVQQCYKFAEIFDLTHSIIRHGEESISVNRLDEHGRPSAFTEDLKVGVIKFDNGSRIIAFSANPQAMAVYGGDVGLDEFAKHPNARLLWETAQGRITWGGDLAVWSSHDGEDTLFNEFAQEARAACDAGHLVLVSPGHWQSKGSLSLKSKLKNLFSSHSTGVGGITPCAPPTDDASIQIQNSEFENGSNPCSSLSVRGSSPSGSSIDNRNSKFENPSSPWNLYFRVSMPDAIRLGLVERINNATGSQFTRSQFLADCRSRARDEEIFEQSYLCNPLGAATASIVPWSSIERCRHDYPIERVHLEANQVLQLFGDLDPSTQQDRQLKIEKFIIEEFHYLFEDRVQHRLGFDVAASGEGDLAAFYIDEPKAADLRLRALLTARTEDWHFLKTVLFFFLRHVPGIQGAGDSSGLGRQICWEAAKQFSSRFTSVNFASKKHDLGFALMNQLSVGEKRFPVSEQDIAADFFALRKLFTGNKWIFTEGRNTFNPASHCDIAWAAALATHAHTQRKPSAGGAVLMEDGSALYFGGDHQHSPEHNLLWSDDPSIWRRVC